MSWLISAIDAQCETVLEPLPPTSQLKSVITEVDSALTNLDSMSEQQLIALDKWMSEIADEKVQNDINFNLIHIEISEMQDTSLGNVWMLH